MPAFLMAAEKGAHMIELDVKMTADGQLVIMHDWTVDRTTDGSGRVDELSLERIRELDAGGWFSRRFAGTNVPLLKEVLESDVPDAVWLNIHTADHGERDAEYVEKLGVAVAEAGRGGQALFACLAGQAGRLRELVPEAKICNMTGQGHAGTDYGRISVELGADWVQFFGWHESTAEACELLHREGLKVNLFKADDAELMRRCWGAGVDFVLTDRLDVALEVWAELGG